MRKIKTSKRRRFLKESGLLLATTLIPSTAFSYVMKTKKYKLGLQLYTIRDAMEKDPIGTLKAARAMGYEDFETFGFVPEKGTYYGFKAKEFKTILDDLGLSASSGHYNFTAHFESSKDDMKRFVDACIEGAKALNKSYITWPWLDPKYRNLQGYQKLPELLNAIGEQVNASGLGFAYHNHGFEFTEYDGQTGYDIIVKNTDPHLVKLQIDLYWVVHSSKLSAEEMIAKDPERYVMWHIKDMDKMTRDYSELGNGSIDYSAMLPQLNQSGLEFYYLEQGGNYAKNSMQSIADSAQHFKNNLQKYL